MDDAAIGDFLKQAQSDDDQQQTERQAALEVTNRRTRLSNASHAVRVATSVSVFLDREGIVSMHLPVDRVADFRDWQTKLILETGEVLHQDEWRGQLLALSSEPPEKAVAIAIPLKFIVVQMR